MNKIKFLVGALAIMGLAVLNFTKSEESFVNKSLASSSSDSSGETNSSSSTSSTSSTSTSSSSNNSCCRVINLSRCNKELTEEKNVLVNCKIITTVYGIASGECQTEIIKYGVVTASVSAEFKAKASVKSTSTSGYEYHTTVVTCPTNGECNNCEEYLPSCN